VQAAQLATSALPTGEPLDGGNRRYVLTERLMRNQAGAGAVGGQTSPFRVWIPSGRLLTIATLGFLPDVGEDATIPAGITIAMDAWTRTDRTRGGRPMRGNGIIPGPFALPNGFPLSYEAVTGVREWRGVLTIPAGGSGIAVDGDIMISVAWEPAAGATDISDVALKTLFDTCKVFPGSGVTCFQSVIG
jgi:hypothetical protein